MSNRNHCCACEAMAALCIMLRMSERYCIAKVTIGKTLGQTVEYQLPRSDLDMRHSKSDNHCRRLDDYPGRLCFLLALVLCCLASQVRAQDPTHILDVREAVTSVNNVRQGSTFEAAVVLDIKYEIVNQEWTAAYHINSAQPYDQQLNPTKLEIEETKGFTISPVKYPKGRDVRLKFSNLPLSVYSGVPGRPVVLTFSVQVAADVPLELYYLRGKLTYQPCSDKGWEAMRSVAVKIPVHIVDDRTKVRRINRSYFGLSTRDYLLIPVRAVKLTACLVKGCS